MQTHHPPQVCPLLLRVFPRRGGHHRLEEFARRGEEPEGELTMYTWPDATLRELTDLVKEVRPGSWAHPCPRLLGGTQWMGDQATQTPPHRTWRPAVIFFMCSRSRAICCQLHSCSLPCCRCSRTHGPGTRGWASRSYTLIGTAATSCAWCGSPLRL